MATYIMLALGEFGAVVDSLVQQKISQEDRLQLDPGRWLINSALPTSKELSEALGIGVSDPLATYIICPIRGYYGRARPDVWEWLAAKSITPVKS